MPETTPLIKAALNLRVGVGFDVYGTQSSKSEKDLLLFLRPFLANFQKFRIRQ